MQKIKGGYEFESVETRSYREEMVRWGCKSQNKMKCLKNRFLGDENLLCL